MDYIEANCYNILRIFTSQVIINRERSIIYRKLHQLELTEYYYVLGEIGSMLNTAYQSMHHDFLYDYYFKGQLQFDDERVNSAVNEYIDWFKSLFISKLAPVLDKIKYERDENYLNYEYQSSRDLDIYLYSTNTERMNIIKKIHDNPFENYYKKHIQPQL